MCNTASSPQSCWRRSERTAWYEHSPAFSRWYLMRINETLCMELSFGNEHVLAVVGFMVVLLFCKQMLECMHSLLQVWQSCAAHVSCCNYGQGEMLCGGMRCCSPSVYVSRSSLYA